MPMESRSIRFPPDLWVRLEQVAKEEDRPLGWVVREACERFLSQTLSIPALSDIEAKVGVKKEHQRQVREAPGPEASVPDEEWLEPEHVCGPKWVPSISRYRCACGRTEKTKW